MLTKSGSWLICRNGDPLGSHSETPTPPQRALVPRLIVLESPASFYSKVLSTLFWALVTLWYLPLVILEISSLLFERREASLINVR